LTRKLAAMSKTKTAPLYKRIREILESARATVARSVNSGLVMANWLIGGEIVEEQQHGSKRNRSGVKVDPTDPPHTSHRYKIN